MQVAGLLSFLSVVAILHPDFSFAAVLSPKVSLSEQVSKHGLGPPEGAETTETETTTEASTTTEGDDAETTTAQNFAGLFTASSTTEAPTSPPPALNDFLPSLATNDTCIDSNNTGFKLRSGAQAQCQHLANYCQHPLVGVRVKIACARTCGGCDLSTIGSILDQCEDQPAEEYPILTLAGIVSNCSSLEYFCRGYNSSEYVIQKCPKTCRYCGYEPPPVPSTTRWDFSTSFVDTVASGVGCSRRRRFGFCYSRRRRMT